MFVFKDYKVETLIISSINKYKKVVNRQKANFLIVKLINLAKIEDLEIKFIVNKKIYQLINDINKVEYYYD